MFAIIPYLRNSRSVVALLEKFNNEGLPARVRIKSKPRNPRTLCIRWGVRDPLYDLHGLRVLNNIDLRILSDKLRFFKHVGKDSGLVPAWTTSDAEAREWGDIVVARYKTAASGGDGIVIWEPSSGADFPVGAPLYTRYQKKTDEYRCHVFKGPDGRHSVRLTQKKGAKLGEDGKAVGVKNWKIRNLENGFVFIKNNFVPPNEVTELASKFMATHFPDVHFCALDIIYHEPTKTALVLEGNTAPGLEGTTVDVYVDYFKEMKNAR